MWGGECARVGGPSVRLRASRKAVHYLIVSCRPRSGCHRPRRWSKQYLCNACACVGLPQRVKEHVHTAQPGFHGIHVPMATRSRCQYKGASPQAVCHVYFSGTVTIVTARSSDDCCSGAPPDSRKIFRVYRPSSVDLLSTFIWRSILTWFTANFRRAVAWRWALFGGPTAQNHRSR